jgi:hypothetical protein
VGNTDPHNVSAFGAAVQSVQFPQPMGAISGPGSRLRADPENGNYGALLVGAGCRENTPRMRARRRIFRSLPA